MSKRYVPPSARNPQRRQEGDTSGNSIQDRESQDLQDQTRSLEQLSLSRPDGRSYEARGRGRGRGYGRARGGWTTNNYRESLPERPPYDDEFFLQEVHDHYWPSNEFHLVTQSSTLNDSHDRRTDLVYVVLFRDANPRWEDDGIIFAHTSIENLPGYTAAFENPAVVEMNDEESHNTYVAGKGKEKEKGPANTAIQLSTYIQDQDQVEPPAKVNHTTTNTADKTRNSLDHPIAVFSQNTPGSDNLTIYFRFLGWYTLQDVKFLHPHSKELIEMMTQKWDIKDSFGRSKDIKRDAERWQQSLNQPWAVLEFKKMDEQGPMPAIQKLPKDPVTRLIIG